MIADCSLPYLIPTVTAAPVRCFALLNPHEKVWGRVDGRFKGAAEYWDLGDRAGRLPFINNNNYSKAGQVHNLRLSSLKFESRKCAFTPWANEPMLYALQCEALINSFCLSSRGANVLIIRLFVIFNLIFLSNPYFIPKYLLLFAQLRRAFKLELSFAAKSGKFTYRCS